MRDKRGNRPKWPKAAKKRWGDNLIQMDKQMNWGDYTRDRRDGCHDYYQENLSTGLWLWTGQEGISTDGENSFFIESGILNDSSKVGPTLMLSSTSTTSCGCNTPTIAVNEGNISIIWNDKCEDKIREYAMDMKCWDTILYIIIVWAT